MSTAPHSLIDTAIGYPATEDPTPVAATAATHRVRRTGMWCRFLAALRLSRTAVCEASAALGEYDYHNHTDDTDGAPWHVEGGRRCARCGKRFRV
jgi:hypothetical protein